MGTHTIHNWANQGMPTITVWAAYACPEYGLRKIVHTRHDGKIRVWDGLNSSIKAVYEGTLVELVLQ